MSRLTGWLSFPTWPASRGYAVRNLPVCAHLVDSTKASRSPLLASRPVVRRIYRNCCGRSSYAPNRRETPIEITGPFPLMTSRKTGIRKL